MKRDENESIEIKKREEKIKELTDTTNHLEVRLKMKERDIANFKEEMDKFRQN